MKCLKNCIFMLPVTFGETCIYENKTVTELNIESNYKKELQE